MKKIGELAHNGEKLFIYETGFVEGGLAFLVMTEFGEPYVKLGVFLTPADMVPGLADNSSTLAEGEFFVRNNEYDQEINKALLATGLFADTGRRAFYGRGVTGQVWRKV